MDGVSWRDVLNDVGFDVRALDFSGFGHSDRYAEMEQPAELHAPLCNARDASGQVEAAVRFILEQQGVRTVAGFAFMGIHAGGTFCLRASVDDRSMGALRTHRASSSEALKLAPSGPAWRAIASEDQWKRFIEDMPVGEPPVISRNHSTSWLSDIWTATRRAERGTRPA